MDHQFCPGAKMLRQPAPEMFTCPGCGDEVEIWTDEFKRRCLNCGRTVFRDATLSCLEWCRHGKECVGDDVYETFMQNKSAGIKRCLLEMIQTQFKDNRAGVLRAKQILRNVEELLSGDNGEHHVLIPASILLDVDVDTARKALLRVGLPMDEIDGICGIVKSYHELGGVDRERQPLLHDAIALISIEDQVRGQSEDQIGKTVDEALESEIARRIARDRLAGVARRSDNTTLRPAQ